LLKNSEKVFLVENVFHYLLYYEDFLVKRMCSINKDFDTKVNKIRFP
jgi:hypothetical protein